MGFASSLQSQSVVRRRVSRQRRAPRPNPTIYGSQSELARLEGSVTSAAKLREARQGGTTAEKLDASAAYNRARASVEKLRTRPLADPMVKQKEEQLRAATEALAQAREAQAARDAEEERALEQSRRRTLSLPADAAARDPSKDVELEQDKFKDLVRLRTRVLALDVTNGFGRHLFSLSATTDSTPRKPSRIDLTMSIVTTSSAQQYARSSELVPTFRLIADGQKIALPRHGYGASDNGRAVYESFVIPLTAEQLTQIGHATKVEGQIGSTELRFSQGDLILIRRFEQRLQTKPAFTRKTAE